MILIPKHEIVTGLPKIEPLGLICKACILGKKTRERAPCQSFHCSKTPLEIIHSDVCGLLFRPSFIGTWYLLTFIDDCSCYRCVYFLKNEVTFLACFKLSKFMLENNLEIPFASFVVTKVVNTLLQHFVITIHNIVSTSNLFNQTHHTKIVWQNKRTKLS
jgi:hypothetical protein